MKKYLVFLFLCIFIWGCNTSRENYFESVEQLNTQNSELRIHPINALIGNPSGIYVKDSLLILCDVVDNKAILIYDLKSETEITRTIHKGNGPQEVILPVSMQAAGDKIGLLQRQTGNYRIYSIESLLSGSPQHQSSTDISGGADVADMTGNGFVSCNYYQDGVLQFSDEQGNVIGNFDIYPEYLLSAPSLTDKFRIGQGKIGYNSHTDRLIFASSFTGQINTYSWNNRELSMVNSISIGSKKIENRIKNSGVFSLTDEDIVHSRQVWVAEDCFYVLYLGAPMKDNRNINLPCYLIRIDNNGEINKTWKFDRRLYCFCISEDQTRLWGIGMSDDQEYEVQYSIL